MTVFNKYNNKCNFLLFYKDLNMRTLNYFLKH